MAPERLLAVDRPRSFWQCVEMTTLSMPGVLAFRSAIRPPNSCGSAHPAASRLARQQGGATSGTAHTVIAVIAAAAPSSGPGCSLSVPCLKGNAADSAQQSASDGPYGPPLMRTSLAGLCSGADMAPSSPTSCVRNVDGGCARLNHLCQDAIQEPGF